MAVAEAKKADKQSEGGSASAPPWLANSVGFVPRKLREFRSFVGEVRAELKKVTWPGREEVRATTLVVLVTTFFFGFYLYGLDLGYSWILSFILKR